MSKLKRAYYHYPIFKIAISPILKIREAKKRKESLKVKALLDNLGELLIEDPVIRVKEFDGIFSLNAHSDLFYRLVAEKRYEPELVALCIKYIDQDKDIIDIGANIGFFSVLFAKNLERGKVLSIEPTSKALKRLKQNIALNEVGDKIDIYEGVASNSSERVEIKTIIGKEEYSSLGGMNHPAILEEKWSSEEVDSIELDDLVAQKSLNPGFIKIDVEGAEHLVFQGARNTLMKSRPIILSELSDFLLKANGSSAKKVIDLIESCNYDIFDPVDSKIRPGSKDFGDIICFPKEMNEKFGQ